MRGLFAEAKANIRKRGAMPLVAENDLKLARFLAGLHVSCAFGRACVCACARG